MKRRTVLVISILMLCVICCACSGADTPTDSEAPPVATGEPAPAPTSEPDMAVALLDDVHTQAEQRKQEILSCDTEIVKSDTFIKGETYTGTAYYISNSGSDENDGLSPETAFATPAALKNVGLQSGDAVFFERGGIWRATELPTSACWVDGITFSAYGQGDMPRIYGSEENGTGGEKWILYHEGDDGRKIWVYYRDMSEVGAIALNGSIPVRRDIAYWDEGSYTLLDSGEHRYELTEQTYSVEEHLPDMYCFPALDYSQVKAENWNDDIFVSRNWSTGESYRPTGKLYFRCDAGNPGELYDSIEFLQPYCFTAYAGGRDTVLDSLCFAYTAHTIGTGNTGWVIQNCEFGWCGGAVSNYQSVLEKEYGDAALGLNYILFGRRGGALSINNPQTTAENNYVHHAFQEGISVEIFEGDEGAADIRIAGNLVEKCNQPLILCNWDKEIDPNHNFKNLVVENNIVLDTAVDSLYNTDWEDNGSAAFTIQGGPNPHDGTVYVRNNIFAVSQGPLIVLPQCNDYMKVFSDNTYIQSADGTGIFVNWQDTYPLEENIAKLLGDETGTLVLLK